MSTEEAVSPEALERFRHPRNDGPLDLISQHYCSPVIQGATR